MNNPLQKVIKKLTIDVTINKYKERLVAKGYTKNGINYEGTYSPVAQFTLIRIILALVAHFDLELIQIDVKIFFLNGELNEKSICYKLEGYKILGQENKVCKPIKTFYSLQQASRIWYYTFIRLLLN